MKQTKKEIRKRKMRNIVKKPYGPIGPPHNSYSVSSRIKFMSKKTVKIFVHV